MRKRADKKEAKEPKARQLTEEEKEEQEEKELEEACEKWCGRIIRVGMLGWMFWGMLAAFSEWLFRPPVLLEVADLTGRLFVLTGGTQGIGAAAARRLVQNGARVVIGTRDVIGAEQFVSGLQGKGNAEVRFLNLGDLQSVVAFAKTFDDEDDGIDGLLSNAGSIEGPCTPTVDGFETTTQVNYLAPVLLSKLLQPMLEQGSGRIVYSSCPVARMSQAKLDPLYLEELGGVDSSDEQIECDGFGRYASAKLMLHAFSAKQAQKFARSGISVTSNVFDPVSVDTPGNSVVQALQPAPKSRMRFNPQIIIKRVVGFIFSPITGPIWRQVSRFFMRGVTEGGDGLVHMVSSPHLDRVSGKYYSLSAKSGLTKLAGCNLPKDECGQDTPPAKVTEDGAPTLWDETHEALAPWLPAKGSGRKQKSARKLRAEEDEDEE